MGQGIWYKMTHVFSSQDQEEEAEETTNDHRRGKEPGNVRFAVYMPSTFEEALRPAEAMKGGNGVVINGEQLDEGNYQRVLDFLDGAAYVLGGSGRRVSETVQVYVPSAMEIVDESISYYGGLTSGKTRNNG